MSKPKIASVAPAPKPPAAARALYDRLDDLHDQVVACAAYSQLVWDFDGGYVQLPPAHESMIRLRLMQSLVETLDALTRELAAWRNEHKPAAEQQAS